MSRIHTTNSPYGVHGFRVAITGGTSGLGLALVNEFLERGAQVAFVARNRERVDRGRPADSVVIARHRR